MLSLTKCNFMAVAGVVVLMIALLNRYNFWIINFKFFFFGHCDCEMNILHCLQDYCNETKHLFIRCEIRFDFEMLCV